MSELKEIEVDTTLKTKNVVWIDQNNNGPENKRYLQICSEALKNFSFTLVTSVKEGYECLSKFKFELIYVILSGRLAEEFLDIYEENLQKLHIITLNIIFCFNGKFHETKKYANDPFYNPGGVVTEFEKVIEFLKKDEKYKIYKINEPKYNPYNNNDIKDVFMFVENKDENIAFPIILKKFSGYFINEKDLEKFKRFLLFNYYEQFKNTDIISFLNPKIKIPYYLYSKIFVRLYTMESNFYRDLSRALVNNNYSDFKVFIFTLYNGLDWKVLEDVHNIPLFTSQKISMDEYNKMINSNSLVLTRKFLSFSKERKMAEYLLKTNLNNFNQSNFKNVLFIVNPLTNNKDVRVTNIEADQLSYYANEKEVLFLPFSGFEICHYDENEDYTIIYLNYLNKYEKKIKDYIDSRSKDKVENFLKSLIKESKSSIFKNIITPELIQSIKDYGDKKTVLWIDQYSRCKLYNDYILKYSLKLNNFYFEKATTAKEAFSILSNYEFKLIYVIINNKLSEEFFSLYEENIKKLGVVTANIIFCEEKSQFDKYFKDDPFLNPGGVTDDFSRVVDYLNSDQIGFENIIKMKKTINGAFAGNNYGNIFGQINQNQVIKPIKMAQKLLSSLPDQKSISIFKSFIYKYGNKELSKVVNPNLEKKINLPLYIYPKFYMRMYGLETEFYHDLNKYLSNQEKDFGIYNTFINILYYGLINKYLISNSEFPFYRGGVISKKEYKNLVENMKEKTIFYSAKNFLSFSRSLKEAEKFLSNIIKKADNNDIYPTKFIIEKYEKIGNNNNFSELMSNVEMRHYSGFATEKEVLFLPLSVFRITYIDEGKFYGKKIMVIKLNYVGMLLK